MSRRLLLAAIVATATTALYVAGPAVAVSILLTAGWMREHALRSGAESRLRAGLRHMEVAMSELRDGVPEAVRVGMATAGEAWLDRLAAGRDDDEEADDERPVLLH